MCNLDPVNVVDMLEKSMLKIRLQIFGDVYKFFLEI
jgi:hypothetical protein